jgi:hypothetical protein
MRMLATVFVVTLWMGMMTFPLGPHAPSRLARRFMHPVRWLKARHVLDATFGVDPRGWVMRERADNQLEYELFGDPHDAPTYPKPFYNGHATFHEGVWCDDAYPVPSSLELRQFRRAHQRAKESRL